MNAERIEYCARKKFKPNLEFVSPYKPESFVITDEMKKWVDEEMPKTERAKCLILVGATRLGKTQWARSLGKHVFWRGMTNLDKWDDSAKYLVLDDIDWEFIPSKKQLLTAMGECELTEKYRAKKTVINNKPAIVCCNQMPNFREHYDYWMENAIIVELTSKLY